jgi:hypothetical protein
MVENFLSANCVGTVWKGPDRDDSDGSYRWVGTKDGAYAFSAALTANPLGHALTIWTKENDDFEAEYRAQETNGM